VDGDEVHECGRRARSRRGDRAGALSFSVPWERVFHLEIALGYQHRGVEEAMIGGPDKRSVHYAETLAGDTSVGHAMAYCQVVESLANCQKSARAQALRGVALELERIANHVGTWAHCPAMWDFLPTASYAGASAAIS